MANEVLGHAKCPLCDFPHQEIRLSSSQKPYLTCDECGVQIFARQPKSVRLMRDMAKTQPDPVAAPPKPAAEGKTAVTATAGGVTGESAKGAQAAGSSAVALPPKAAKPAEEETIFDWLINPIRTTTNEDK